MSQISFIVETVDNLILGLLFVFLIFIYYAITVKMGNKIPPCFSC
jgi:hypothetical protein